MSLIDEALKRARMEAAQKAAEKEGLPYPTIPRHLGPRRRRGWLAPTAVLLAILGGVAVGLLLARRGGAPAEQLAAVGAGGPPAATAGTLEPEGRAASPRDSPPADTDPAPPAATPAPSPVPAGVDAQPAAPPAAAAPIAAEPHQPGAVRRDPAPRPTVPDAAAAGATAPQGGPAERPPIEPTTPAAAAPRPAPTPRRPAEPPPTPRREIAVEPALPGAQAAPSDARSTATADSESEVLLVLPEGTHPPGAAARADAPVDETIESHVQQVAQADGALIELGGIAWSESGPFALINGRVVGPGSAIGAYTLERIQPGHVVLIGEGRRIHLSLQ